MFGSEPGKERRQGVMNQHIVTRLDAQKVMYFVLHTRGEDPVSVFITALIAEAKRVKKEPDETAQWIDTMVRPIVEQKQYTTKEQYDHVKDLHVVPWGHVNGDVTLESLVGKAKGSCVLAFVKVNDDE